MWLFIINVFINYGWSVISMFLLMKNWTLLEAAVFRCIYCNWVKEKGCGLLVGSHVEKIKWALCFVVWSRHIWKKVEPGKILIVTTCMSQTIRQLKVVNNNCNLHTEPIFISVLAVRIVSPVDIQFYMALLIDCDIANVLEMQLRNCTKDKMTRTECHILTHSMNK